MKLFTEYGSIYYEREGKGKVLFFLHGNGESGQIYDHIVPFFKDDFTVIRMDTRGHGRSDLGPVPLTFKQIADDIIRIFNEENVEKASIIGFSDGGNLALYTAAHHPSRVESVVTMGANFEVDGVVDWCTADMLNEKMCLEAEAPSQEIIRKQAVLALMLKELDLDATLLQKIHCPVLVMAGKRDVIKEEHTRELARLTRAQKVVIVPDGDHDFFMNQPLALVKPVKQFLLKQKTMDK